MSETSMRLVLTATADQAMAVVDGFAARVGEITTGFVKNGLALGAAWASYEGVKELIGGSIDAATKEQTAQVQLANALQNSGTSYKEQAPKIDEAVLALQRYGFTSAQTQDALKSAAIGLKDPEKALTAVSVAADLAKAKNLDLDTATNLVVKGMEGFTRPLKALGIDLPVFAGNATAVAKAQGQLADAQQKVNDILAKAPDAADPASKANASYALAVSKVASAQENLTVKQSAGDEILKGLSDRVKGSASASMDTFAGKQEIMRAKFDDIQVKIGTGLLPLLVTMADWMINTGIPALNNFSNGWNNVAGATGNAATVGQAAKAVFDGVIGTITTIVQAMANISNWLSNPSLMIANQVSANNAPALDRQLQAAINQNSMIRGQNAGNRIPNNALGGTYDPVPGGQIVRLAEAGRRETIVDTDTLNKAMMRSTGRGNSYFTINQVTDTIGTATALARRQNMLASV